MFGQPVGGCQTQKHSSTGHKDANRTHAHPPFQVEFNRDQAANGVTAWHPCLTIDESCSPANVFARAHFAMGGPHGGGGPHGTPLRLGTRSRHGRRAPRGAPLHGGRQRQIRGSVPSHGARVLEVRIDLPPAEIRANRLPRRCTRACYHRSSAALHYWPPPVVGALITTQRVLASGLP